MPKVSIWSQRSHLKAQIMPNQSTNVREITAKPCGTVFYKSVCAALLQVLAWKAESRPKSGAARAKAGPANACAQDSDEDPYLDLQKCCADALKVSFGSSKSIRSPKSQHGAQEVNSRPNSHQINTFFRSDGRKTQIDRSLQVRLCHTCVGLGS